MDTIEENLKYFIEKFGDIYEAYETYGKKVHYEGGPLDDKIRWLIKVAVSASCQHHYSVKTHIRKAIKSGCTREEIEHALLLTAPTAGFPTMMESILCLRNELDQK